MAGVTRTDSAFVREFAKASQVSFGGGMQQLTDTLEQRLSEDGGVRIIKGDPVCEIGTHPAGTTTTTGVGLTGAAASVRLASGEVIECDHIFSTLPAPALRSALLSSLEDRGNATSSNDHTTSQGATTGHAHMAATVSDLLDDIHAVDVGVVNLAFATVPKKLADIPGFGYLVPATENDRVLGVSFDSCIFPTQGTAALDATADVPVAGDDAFRVCVMIGGVHGRDVADMTEEELTLEAKSGLSRHVGLSDADLDTIVAAKAGVMQQCIPQYYVGHNALVRNIERALDPGQGPATHDPPSSAALTVLGNSFYGVGIADCISRAWSTAQQFSKAQQQQQQ